jgi:hypothetical protein
MNRTLTHANAPDAGINAAITAHLSTGVSSFVVPTSQPRVLRPQSKHRSARRPGDRLNLSSCPPRAHRNDHIATRPSVVVKSFTRTCQLDEPTTSQRAEELTRPSRRCRQPAGQPPRRGIDTFAGHAASSRQVHRLYPLACSWSRHGACPSRRPGGTRVWSPWRWPQPIAAADRRRTGCCEKRGSAPHLA